MRAKIKALTRSDRSAHTRVKLLKAAMAVVGKYGYGDASIARICDNASIAQGTFYNYFKSRQEIFDLLPVHYGEAMLAYIRTHTRQGLTGVDREVERFRVFFDFFYQNREIARVVNEAPILAPTGYLNFYQMVRDNYSRAIRRSIAKGEIRDMEPAELLVLVNVLIAIRNGLSQQMLVKSSRQKQQIKVMTDFYRDMVTKAIFDKA